MTAQAAAEARLAGSTEPGTRRLSVFKRRSHNRQELNLVSAVGFEETEENRRWTRMNADF
jgi:hypothetical protein